MTSNPTNLARLGFNVAVWLRNSVLSSSGSTNDIWSDRVQNVEAMATDTTQDYYELGRIAKVGVTTNPTEYRVTLSENLHNNEIDMYLAGVNPTTGSGYYIANMVSASNSAYVVTRNDAGSVDGEIAIGTARVADVTYKFTANGASTIDYTLEGTSGSYYANAGTYVHPLWGVLDNTSVGGVHGKEAWISFGNPVSAGTKAYRLQTFTVKAAMPVQTIRELGNRSLVGKLVDSPNVTVDFDLLTADVQPHDIFYPVSNDGGVAKYALGQPQTVDIFINVYDPNSAEAAVVIKGFRVENCKPTSDSPIRAQVRGLATSKFTLTCTGERTGTGTGGLAVSKTAFAS
jgi:hypothetical protein